MSGGSFTNYNYSDSSLANDIFGYRVSLLYGFGPDKFYSKKKGDGCYEHYSSNYSREDYLANLKTVRKNNPFDDVVISELVYDVLCLVHSKDYAESGDTTDDQYEDDVKAFKDKWFGGRFRKEYAKELFDERLEATKNDVYRALGIDECM